MRQIQMDGARLIPHPPALTLHLHCSDTAPGQCHPPFLSARNPQLDVKKTQGSAGAVMGPTGNMQTPEGVFEGHGLLFCPSKAGHRDSGAASTHINLRALIFR